MTSHHTCIKIGSVQPCLVVNQGIFQFMLGDNEQEVEEPHEEEKQEQDSVNERPRANEFNQPPLPKSTNFLGEDVDSLMISLYDRKRNKYICQECKIICNLPMVWSNDKIKINSCVPARLE